MNGILDLQKSLNIALGAETLNGPKKEKFQHGQKNREI